MEITFNSTLTFGCRLWVRNSQEHVFILIHRELVTGCLDGQNLEKNRIGKLEMKEYWKEVQVNLPEWSHSVKKSVPHFNI